MIKIAANSSKKRGFTLIELLVVIAIIGVLASIVLASLNSARRKSRDARRITDIKQIQLALELHFDGAGSGQYPAATVGPCATDEFGLRVLATSGYIPQVPHDPQSFSTCYSYAAPSGTRTTYHLGASLEDTNNPAKDGDKDCSSITPATCSSVTYTSPFNGADSAGCAGETGKLCYDVIP